MTDAGHPLATAGHMEHHFAVHLAHSRRMAGGETDEYPEAAFCLDRNPDELGVLLTEQTARQAHQAVFGEFRIRQSWMRS